MKRIVLVAVIAILLATSTKAAEVSVISTSFEIKKLVNCDRVNMTFKVWAEGDNYTEALKRLKPINNEFVGFLKKIYASKSIKTVSGYNSSKMASIIITVNSDKINSTGRVLNYISNRRFPYKTGITTVNIKYTLSDKKETEIKNEIFKEALVKCKRLLSIVNSTLNSKYKIGSIDVKYSHPFFIREGNIRAFSKSSPNSNFSLSSGQKLIKANVRFSAILTLK
ncbi:SIMPL domain-containing protein [Hippea alviniae]|uniref:SIMPL domain-containing protein n=1 Tax=Hippea alviniae TaxID=1279027 RepID=UPI0003B6D04C|nr:SIMPL domain-containing protein [Hippea alviniae]